MKKYLPIKHPEMQRVILKPLVFAFSAFLALICLAGFASAGFVTVNGTEFYHDGKPFYFAGANTYYAWYGNYQCTNYDVNQGCTREILDDASAMGLKVLRVWGFSNGYNYWGSLQPSPWTYDEASFRKLDLLIKEAGARNIKLIIVLANNWDDFGGMCKYVQWCDATVTSCSANMPVKDRFYSNSCCKTLYKGYVNYMLNRVNYYTGVKYKKDPTIMAWELANEPRAANDDRQTRLDSWIEEMSTYIRSIDKNHLVTTGLEGWTNAGVGTDFIKNHNHKNIDFAVFHLLSEDMGFDLSSSLEWVNSHMDAAVQLGKPVVLEEIGKKTGKASYLSAIYDLLGARWVDGGMFWMLKDYKYPNWDSYGINYPENTKIVAEIKEFSSKMNYRTGKNPMFYDYARAFVDGNKEHRLYYNKQHFLTIIETNGALAIRPHPGVDINGWGSTLYLQPFLPGAVLRDTVIDNIALRLGRVDVSVSGKVSKGAAESYGDWQAQLKFSYDSAGKKVTGSGTYTISLAGSLSDSTGDLNLYKIASNYLNDVPLLDGTTGDTGDMQYADVAGDSFNFTWDPVSMPSYFPGDTTDNLLIDVSGGHYNLDSAAQGYESIAEAYKPSLSVQLSSTTAPGLPMIFGAIYDLSKSQDFWEDNVGITPLVLKNAAGNQTSFSFNLAFSSEALAGDGSLSSGGNSSSPSSSWGIPEYYATGINPDAGDYSFTRTGVFKVQIADSGKNLSFSRDGYSYYDIPINNGTFYYRNGLLLGSSEPSDNWKMYPTDGFALSGHFTAASIAVGSISYASAGRFLEGPYYFTAEKLI